MPAGSRPVLPRRRLTTNPAHSACNLADDPTTPSNQRCHFNMHAPHSNRSLGWNGNQKRLGFCTPRFIQASFSKGLAAAVAELVALEARPLAAGDFYL